MTKMRTASLMLVLVLVAIPVVLYAQSDLTQTTADNFTIAPDPRSGGVWRLNADSGELWFCLASAEPKCYLAVNTKK
jgi:hypothetical protein